jgi:hypothetical protein
MPPGAEAQNPLMQALLASRMNTNNVGPSPQQTQLDPTNPVYYATPKSPQQIFSANSAYAKPSSSGYLTTLPPSDEANFQAWLQKNSVPFDPSQTADYDMRGFWKGLISGDPHAETGVNQNDGRLHFSDYWKTPYHMSFSGESQFARPGAPTWNDQDQLVLPNGQVVFDERAMVRGRQN